MKIEQSQGSTEMPEHDVLHVRELLMHAGVGVGMTVADMGTGREGSFVLEAARMVSQTGQVYALDVVKDILSVIDGMAAQAGLHNVKTIWTDLELYGAAVDIGDGTVDVGILANTIFQSTEKEAMMKEVVRMIKIGGKLLVIDWKKVDTIMGPPTETRVSSDEIKKIGLGVGLQMLDQFEAGEYHWGILFQK